MNNERLAWLAGIWDGEGTITVFLTHRDNNEPRYNPALVLTNTNDVIISEAVKILDELEIRMFLFHNHKSNPNYKDAYQLTTRKLTSVKKFCEIMIPFLVGKKAQAELTLRFVNSRLKVFEKNGSWSQHNKYTEEEISLCEQLKRLNQRGKHESSTTIRLTETPMI